MVKQAPGYEINNLCMQRAHTVLVALSEKATYFNLHETILDSLPPQLTI